MSKLLMTAAIVSATAFAGAAYAQDEGSGWYGAARAGLATMNDPELTFTDTATSDNIVTRLHTDNAFGAAGELGYRWNGWRFAGELSYQKHDADSITFVSANGTPITAGDVGDALDALEDAGVIGSQAGLTASGTTVSSSSGSIAELRQVGFMANAAYDIPTGTSITPYVMGGVGGVNTHAEAFGEGDSVTRFAWQLGAGAAVDVASNVQLTADYRYRQTSGGDLGDVPGVDIHLGSTKSHFIAVGGRVRF
jgi:opacity protein-like surface antigen